MLEKIPQLDTSEGISGFPLCPLGKAYFKKNNS